MFINKLYAEGGSRERTRPGSTQRPKNVDEAYQRYKRSTKGSSTSASRAGKSTTFSTGRATVTS